MEKFKVKDNICLFTEKYSYNNTYVNVYLVRDESPVLVNVGPPEKSKDFMEVISESIPLEEIKIVLLLDSEREHVGAIPAFVSKLPKARFITSWLNYDLIINYTADIKLEMMREKWVLKSGKNRIKFFESMIPTPESLFVLIDGVLFTGSAFALDLKDGHIDESDRMEDIEELFHLYRNRAHKIGEYMEKLGAHEIEAIAPAHGPVLKGNVGDYIEKWKILSNTLKGQEKN